MHCWCCLLCTCIALVLSMLLHAVERGYEQASGSMLQCSICLQLL